MQNKECLELPQACHILPKVAKITPPPIATPHQDVYDLVADETRLRQSNTWRPDGTRDWLLILTLAGEGRVCSGDAEVIARPGVATLYQPNTPQHYFALPDIGNWHILWSHFYPRPDWAFWLKWPETARGFRTLFLHDGRILKKVVRALRDATYFSRQQLSGSSDFAANALECAILWLHSANRHRHLDERIRKAVERMAEQFHEPIAFQRLARDCGMSFSRMAHLFKEQIGVPPGAYLESIRLQRAVQLLRSTGFSVGEIADQTGFVNAFYFSKRFKKEFGQSPSLYRRSMALPPPGNG